MLDKTIILKKSGINYFALNLPNILSSLITATTFAALMSPGLIHGDSRWVMGQAVSKNINTWHPALLTEIWGHVLGAAKFGPLFPFLIQVFSFYLGIYFAMFGLAKYLGRLTVVIPPLTLLLPQVWYIAWVCTDGFWVAFSCLSAGLLVAYLANRNQLFFLYLSLVIGAALYMCRPVFIAVPLIYPIYFLFKSTTSRKKQITAIVFCVILPIISVKAAISFAKPHKAYPDSFILLGDLAWAECYTRAASDSLPVSGLLPRVFVVKQDRDFCKNFNPVSIQSLFVDLGDGYDLRYIQNKSEHQLAQKAWIELWLDQPQLILEKKFSNYFSSVLTVGEIPLAPNLSWGEYPLDSLSEVSFNSGVGFPLTTPILVRNVYTFVSPIWNFPILGFFLVNAYLFPMLGLVTIRRALIVKHFELDWKEPFVLLFSLFSLHILLFLVGMTSEPTRYFQMTIPSFTILFAYLVCRSYPISRSKAFFKN